MAKSIGPNFPNELAAAGLLGLPFSWTSVGDIFFAATMTAPQIAAVQAVYAAHDPTKLDPATQLAAKLAAGVALTSTATPAISATYALDPTTLDQIGSVARDAAAGLGLPGGLTSFTYPDITGNPKSFSGANIQALYKAMRDVVFALNTAAATLAAGGAANWPMQTATIA